MDFTIEELRRAPDGAMYTSPARICVSADGELVSEDDPRAVRLLVAEGGQIPAAEAAQYGLIAEPSSAADDDDLSSSSAADLRARAEALGIDVPQRATKAQIIAAIEEATEQDN